MGVLRFKIIRDLWRNKGRTLQVVLTISIGAAAIGMILTTRNLVVPGMQDMWQSINPAMINIFVGPPVDEDEMEALAAVDGVEVIEGLNNTTIEWRLTPQDEWQQGGLNARADYEEQQLNKLELVQGDWPTDDIFAVNQGDDVFFGIPLDGTVYLRVNDREYEIEVGSVVYNQLSQPAAFGGSAQFFTTIDEYERMVGNRDFSQLMVSAAEWDEDAVTELADRVQKKLEDQGKDSGRMITDPNKHFFQDSMDGLFMLLGVMGVLSLILGTLMVYNTVTALIARQVDQIGVMKAVGARTWQILLLYLSTVFIYGLLALLIALPSGVWGGWAVSNWLVGSFGADFGGFEYSRPAIWIMVIITLLAPLLASIFPVISGARITVREAISTYGLSTDTGLIEILLSRARRISRLVLITISNTFRNKWRVVLMQVTLVLSGLIFMMVISVRDSVVYTVRDVLFEILNADITLIFERGQRIDHIEEITLAHPAVKAVEMWGLTNITIRPAGQEASEDDEQALMLGVPLPTQLYGYQLRAGRWLNPDDGYAIVLNQELAEEVGVEVGDWITVQYEENNKRDFLIVGLVFDPVLTTSANAPRNVMLHDLNSVDKAGTVWIQTNSIDHTQDEEIAKGLRDYYKQHHADVSAQRGIFGMGSDSTYGTATSIIQQFDFIITLLAIMAVVIGVVGSIALSGALSLSVMERTREIGVMRAIGASSWAIFRLFIGEGLILGWLSWLIALPLSIPAGRLMIYALGQAFGLEMIYKYTPTGAIMWLFIITILSIVASWLPARGATRVSVRESLAYQ